MNLPSLDQKLIHFSNKFFTPLARFAIFAVYFWFGILKVLGLSPAGPLIHSLFDQTISMIPFNTFYWWFAWFEVLIGILFLFSRFTRVVMPLLIVHMMMTAGPLLLLPEIAWQSFLVPTLEGQYIIKNVVIVACAIGIAGHLHRMRASKNHPA